MSTSKPPPLENVRRFNAYRYVVWTQAGFKQACRMLRESTGDTENTDDACPIEGYPESYPSMVVFSSGYEGYHYWQAMCRPLDKAIENARAQLSFLETADAEHKAAIGKNTP